LTDEAAAATVTAKMKGYLASDDLLFLMQLSIAPIRAALAKERDGVGR
jgi:hypothetical protein